MTDAELNAIAEAMAEWEGTVSSSPRWSTIGWRTLAVDPMLEVLDRLGYDVVRRG
jgi:hypothetical protein